MTGWQDIKAEVLARIHARAWPPGSAIPHEAALAQEFGVARATVNRALRSLAQAGWLDRRRKAGTRVALHPVRKATLSIPILRAEVTALGHAYAHRLLSRDLAPAPDAIAAALALPTATMLWHIVALHLADDAPFAAEDRWVNPAAIPGFADADLTRTSANEWLVQHAPFTHGDFTIAAARAGAGPVPIAPCGAALLTVTRTTWDGFRPITWVRLTFAQGHQIRAAL